MYANLSRTLSFLSASIIGAFVLLLTFSTTSLASTEAPPEPTVRIESSALSPALITVTVGSQVSWYNATDQIIQLSDQPLSATTTNEGVFLPFVSIQEQGVIPIQDIPSHQTGWTSEYFAPLDTFTYTFATTGIFSYYASHSPNLIGIVNVEPAGQRITTTMVISPVALLLTGTNESKVLTAQIVASDGTTVTSEITWHSSNPEQVSVDDLGRVTALVQSGSALITATADGLNTSSQVAVTVAQPMTGTILIADNQVVAPPVPVNPSADPILGSHYQVTLKNLTPPTPGTLILATEGTQLRGRVVSAQQSGESVEVVFETIPLNELFANFKTSFVLDLSPSETLIRQAISDGATVWRLPDNSLVLRYQVAESDRVAAAGATDFKLGPFTCDTDGPFKLEGRALDIKITNELEIFAEVEREWYQPVPTRLHVETYGALKVSLSGGLTFNSASLIDVECRFLLPLDALTTSIGMVISPSIGMGIDLDLEVQAFQAEWVFQRELGASLRLGFDYQEGHGITYQKDFEIMKGGQAGWDGRDMIAEQRLVAGTHVYGVLLLGAGVGPIRYDLLEATFGPRLDGSFSYIDIQANDPSYASSYESKNRGHAGIVHNVFELFEWFGLSIETDLFSIDFDTILNQSPHGVLTSSTPAATVGDPVTLTVRLDPTDLRFDLVGYNIARVNIYKARNGHLVPVATLEPTEDAQYEFSWTWHPTSQELDENKFYAFVTTNFIPWAPLEIASNSAISVLVRSPTIQPPIVTDVRLATGTRHTCAITEAGGLKCWGSNLFGQIGDGTRRGDGTDGGEDWDGTFTHHSPVDVLGLTSGVKSVTTGNYHTCALTEAGGVKCWGYPQFGKLGDGIRLGENEFRAAPVDVVGLSSGVKAIDAGLYHLRINSGHTCAVTNDGGAKCWGANMFGQLGDGTTGDESNVRLTPVDVIGLNAPIATIAVGFDYTCALTEAGGVKCWGANTYGQLGDGTTGDNNHLRLTPVDVVGLSSGVKAIAAGNAMTCAITVAGAVKCWGFNEYGLLGDGTTGGNRLTPVDVVGLSSGVKAITIGDIHACAITGGGGIKCWGSRHRGALGDGINDGLRDADSLVPVDVIGISSGAIAISAGQWFTCAIMETGRIKCWGESQGGQLGDGTEGDENGLRLTPVDVLWPGD